MDTVTLSDRLVDLLLSPEHILLVMAPIMLLLILRWVLPAAYDGRLASVAVLYPAPLTIGGALAGLTGFDGLAARVAVGIVAWGIAAVVYKLGKPVLGPWLARLVKRTTGVDIPPDQIPG